MNAREELWPERFSTSDRKLIAAKAAARLAADKAEGQRAADEWNAQHPVGTPVMAYPITRPGCPGFDERTALTTRTRSRAWILGHGAPVVLVEGYSGGIYLSHVNVITEGGAR